MEDQLQERIGLSCSLASAVREIAYWVQVAQWLACTPNRQPARSVDEVPPEEHFRWAPDSAPRVDTEGRTHRQSVAEHSSFPGRLAVRVSKGDEPHETRE